MAFASIWPRTLARELHEVDKLAAFFDIIHQDPVLVAGEADRRAVGSSARAATRSATFPVGGPNGTASIATPCAASGKATAARSANSPRGSPARAICTNERPAPVRQHQFHHLPRRFHAARPRCATTTSTTRPTAKKTATAPTTTTVGTAAPKARPTIRAINALREQQKRNFLATLLLSQGVPMLLAGDELGHTQQGNNNAYCQDNELTWLDWTMNPDRQAFLRFRAAMSCRFASEHPVLARRRFFHGRRIRGKGIRDIIWLNPTGREMTDADWNAGFIQSVGVLLAGDVDEAR